MKSQSFNRWVILEDIKNTRPRLCIALCVCGNKKTVHKQNITRGLSKSCGCWNREILDKKTKDAFSKTRTYRIYNGIKTRCYNKKNKAYEWYGKRGIKMCTRWNNYWNFVEDMGFVTDGFSIDRIDPNGNYEPSNCRWANKLTQSNNTRTNKFIEFKGETKTMAQWCRELGLKYQLTAQRINREKWPIEKVFQSCIK